MKRALRALGLLLGVLIGLEVALQAVHFAFFRNHDVADSTIGPVERFRILCIGESTTVGFPLERSSPDTYPNTMKRRLERAYPDLQFDVSNQGIIGVTTSTVLERLPGWVDAYRPHAIVAMTGINDQFYHNVAYVDDLPTRALLALQQLRTYKLAALVWEQLGRRGASRPTGAVSHRVHLRLVGVYKRVRLHMAAQRHAEAEALLGPLLAEIESLRVPGSEGSDTGELLTLVPVQLIGLYYESNTMLAAIYLRTGREPLAVDLYRRAIELEPRLAGLHFELSRLFDRLGDDANSELLRERASALLSEFVLKPTLDNYAGIRDVAIDRGIPLVAVQYPLRDVNHLKIMLGERESVFFVDNQRSFEEAVERHGYREIFRDAFAGDFGHLTVRGNALLVDNIVEQALGAIVARSARQATSTGAATRRKPVPGD